MSGVRRGFRSRKAAQVSLDDTVQERGQTDVVEQAPKLLLRLRLEPYGVYAREGKSSLHLIPILDDSGRTD